jgi:hypothetical protein
MSSEVASESILPCETAESATRCSVASFVRAEEDGNGCSFRMLGSKVALEVSIERERLQAGVDRAFDRPVMAPSVLAASPISRHWI